MSRQRGRKVNPRPDRNVIVNYEHPRLAPPVVEAENLFLKRMEKLLGAMQLTIYEAPGIPVMSAEVKSFATSVVTAFESMEKEAKVLMKRRNRP